ncbi:MAG: Gfo/Idh/MocA family oxidoreductase [Candidatus Omnitrophica bacterium]|nr:Gfo/Idh/MocA family oxidoreductase [Candidatus Omnitrophota bacterium]
MENKMINVGVIGVGYWGGNLVRVFLSTGRSNVKYVSDLHEKNLNKIRMAYPDMIITKNYADILKDKQIDLVCIATPPESHFEIAKKCILAKKNILIEKPMTKTVKEGKVLIGLARKNKVQIFVDHTFVFSATVRKLKSIIDEGKIGGLLYFDSERINLGLLQKDVNVIWDLAPHDFSIFNYLFPKLNPESVQVFASKHKHPYLEDIAHIMIRYKNDFIMHIHVSWLSPVKIRKIIISGDKGMVWYDDIHPFEKIKIYDKGVHVNFNKETAFFPIYRDGDIITPKLNNYEPLNLEANHIIDCLHGSDNPVVDGNEGLKVVQLLEACDKAVSLKREVRWKGIFN